MSKYNLLSDAVLSSLLKEGDREAFTEIYERYKYILHAHALNKIRDREEARDVIQEVFIYLWDKREVINIDNNLSGYLYKAVRNAILNKITHKQVQGKYLDAMKSFSIKDNIETDYRIRERQLTDFIEGEIARLPSKMREIFELSRKAHLSHHEIAEKLNISDQTVSKQVTNALKILRVKLGIFIYFLFLINS
ncbi:MAG TPA: RNA polymerase sigma-70 factor [Sphingobacteriaceae bacterium]